MQGNNRPSYSGSALRQGNPEIKEELIPEVPWKDDDEQSYSSMPAAALHQLQPESDDEALPFSPAASSPNPITTSTPGPKAIARVENLRRSFTQIKQQHRYLQADLESTRLRMQTNQQAHHIAHMQRSAKGHKQTVSSASTLSNLVTPSTQQRLNRRLSWQQELSKHQNGFEAVKAAHGLIRPDLTKHFTRRQSVNDKSKSEEDQYSQQHHTTQSLLTGTSSSSQSNVQKKREDFDDAPRYGQLCESIDFANDCTVQNSQSQSSEHASRPNSNQASPRTQAQKQKTVNRQSNLAAQPDEGIAKESPVDSAFKDAPCIVPSGRRRLYRVTTKALGVRTGPDVNASRTGAVLRQNDIFEASVVASGVDGRIYLKLAGWRGWVFDDSNVDPLDPSVQQLDEQETAALLANQHLYPQTSHRSNSSSGSTSDCSASNSQPRSVFDGQHHQFETEQRIQSFAPQSTIIPDPRMQSIIGSPRSLHFHKHLSAAFSPNLPDSYQNQVVQPPLLSNGFREAMGLGLQRPASAPRRMQTAVLAM